MLMNLGLPTDLAVVLCPLLTPSRLSFLDCSKSYPVARNSGRPPGVSQSAFHSMRRIYPSSFRMTMGIPGSLPGYPERQALYPISVRHIKCLPPASFRFHLTMDTLAFSYKIPVITALSGLKAISLRTW